MFRRAKGAIKKRSKELTPKMKERRLKNNNFAESIREKSNIAIVILEKALIAIISHFGGQ